MSQYSCPTVAIQLEITPENPTGIVLINESDFDAATMTKTVSADVIVAETVEAPVEVAPKIVAPWTVK
jgi:hypothetical protein